MQCAGLLNIKERDLDERGKGYYLEQDVVSKINNWYRGRAYIYDNNAVNDDMEDLPQTIQKAICRYGVKLVCIDSLMTAMDVSPGDDLYRAQSDFLRNWLKWRYNTTWLLYL